MASLAQIGWWEADLTAGYYLCSDYLCDLLGLDGNTISASDFLNLIREDYRKQIAREFQANTSIHKDFYEQTFPIHSKYGEVWLHTRLAFRSIKKALPRLSRRFRLQKRCGLEMSVQFASVSFQQIHMNIITRSMEKLYRILMQCSLQEESTGEKDQRKAKR